MSVMLTWEQVEEQFNNLVKFAARNTYMSRVNVDNAVSVEDLYQTGMTKLYDCFIRYNHLSMDEFKPVFSTALFRAVRRGARPQMCLDIEAAVENEPFEWDDFTEIFSTSEIIDELKTTLNNPIALAILHELIEPSPRTLFEVWADRTRKEKVKSQGKNVNIPKFNRVGMKHIKQALEITQKQFDLGIAEIRLKSRLVFGLA